MVAHQIGCATVASISLPHVLWMCQGSAQCPSQLLIPICRGRKHGCVDSSHEQSDVYQSLPLHEKAGRTMSLQSSWFSSWTPFTSTMNKTRIHKVIQSEIINHHRNSKKFQEMTPNLLTGTVKKQLSKISICKDSENKNQWVIES